LRKGGRKKKVMEIDALIFMLSSWGLIIGILVFCFTMLFRNPDSAAVLVDNKSNEKR
jgi:hypothetical protein